MKLRISKPLLLDIIVFLFMVLFIYASVIKLFDYDVFRGQIGKSPLITKFAGLLAWLVPTTELIIVVMLFIPALRLIGLYAAFSIMFAFSAYIALMLVFSPYVPCSCGGILSSMGWTAHLIFNVIFTLLAIVGIVIHTRHTRNQIAAIA